MNRGIKREVTLAVASLTSGTILLRRSIVHAGTYGRGGGEARQSATKQPKLCIWDRRRCRH